MKKKNEFYAGTFVLLCSMLFSLFVGEIIVRYISSEKLIYNIEMAKYAKTLKTIDPNKKASHIHKKNTSANLMGVEIKLNSLGHRSPELNQVKLNNEIRTFVLGSSVTMGWGVEFSNVFSEIASKKLNNNSNVEYSFANAGIGNYNNKFQYALFKKQFKKVNPDIVLLHYFISDAEERPIEKNNVIFKYSYLAAFLFDRLNTLQFMFKEDTTLFNYYNLIYKDNSIEWKNTIKRIIKMKNFLKYNDTRFLIMIIPDFHSLDTGNKLNFIYKKIEEEFKSQNIEVINTYKNFQEKFGDNPQELWVQKDDPHPNHKGHKLMADKLYNFYKNKY